MNTHMTASKSIATVTQHFIHPHTHTHTLTSTMKLPDPAGSDSSDAIKKVCGPSVVEVVVEPFLENVSSYSTMAPFGLSGSCHSTVG